MKQNRQRGAAMLLELGLVLILSTLGVAGALVYQRDQVVTERFQAQGSLLTTASNGVNTYIANNYAALVSGAPIAGVVNIYAPTIAELRALSYLPTGFNDVGLFGQAYAVRVARTPTGCVAPACDITGLTYLNGPLIDPATGNVNGAGLGSAIGKMSGDGAYSSNIDPTMLSGIGGAFTIANPVAGTAGILGARTGYGSSAFAQFLRRDGSLPMTGNLNLGNQSITNANDITATGTARARDVVATNNVTATNTVAAATVTATTAVNTADLNATGRTTTNDLALNRVVVAGAACAPNGLIARDAAGLTLSCQSGVYAGSKSAPITRVVYNSRSAWRFVNTTVTCNANEYVMGGGGACPGGDGFGFVFQSTPTDSRSWYINCVTPENATITAQAWATCAAH